MQNIKSASDLDQLTELPVAILLKHSTRCPISARAYGQVTELHDERPETPIYILDVNAQSRLSAQVAERFGVAHDSPQAFVLRLGQPVWSATHNDITAKRLAEKVGE